MYLVLAVADVERSLEFYRSVFGWESELSWPDTYSELVVNEFDRLGLYRRDRFALEAAADPVELAGRHSPAYLYVRVDDLDRTIERLSEAGARPLSPRAKREWGEEAAWFADPDGHIVAVAHRPS